MPESALGEGCLPGGGVCSRGVSALGAVWFWGVSAPRGCGIPACTEADTPPVNRMTDRCKNITLATTSLQPVNVQGSHFSRCTLIFPGFPGRVGTLNVDVCQKCSFPR